MAGQGFQLVSPENFLIRGWDRAGGQAFQEIVVLRQLSDFFAVALCSVARQVIRRVNDLAFRAMSDVFSSLLASPVWYATTLLSRKSRSAPVLIAKLMFSGMSPVALTNFNAFNFAATIPTTSPLESSSGPPLLPG